MSLPRRVAIVTGASSGIGKATAVQLAVDGYNLSLSGRDEKSLEETKSECLRSTNNETSVVTTVGDVTDSEILKQIVENTIQKFGRLDTLINNAGIVSSAPIATAPISDYDKMFDINVKSVVILTKLCIPELVKTRGTIVNVSSIAGSCSHANVAYYCMSKAALDMFTKCLSLELAPNGVRVNAVSPGVIKTNLHRRGGMDEQQYAAFLEHSKTTHALGRVGETAEVARAVSFLARDDSSFITGDLLKIDGGRSLITPR